MDSLFNKTNCDRSAITDMLGGASGVTDANMMQVTKQLFAFYCNYLVDTKNTKFSVTAVNMRLQQSDYATEKRCCFKSLLDA